MVERNKGCVLIVEDDMDTRLIYATILKRAGYRVAEASDVGEALEAISAEKPAAILLDIGLPRFGGWGLASVLRADPDTANVPIAVVTAYDSHNDRDWARRLGVERFMPKPVDPLSVEATVKELIGEADRRTGGDRRSFLERRMSDVHDFINDRRSGEDRRVLERRLSAAAS